MHHVDDPAKDVGSTYSEPGGYGLGAGNTYSELGKVVLTLTRQVRTGCR